jgi:hypothetical protein
MIKIAFRIALTALVFTFIFPMISGVHFTGEFWPQGIAYGFLMAAVAYLFSYVVGLFIVATLGIGAIFVLFGFWLIPAIELQILAHFFPQNLAFDSWGRTSANCASPPTRQFEQCAICCKTWVNARLTDFSGRRERACRASFLPSITCVP